MNSVSSRSHAIFSVILKQHKTEQEDGKSVVKTLNSKFHFVDLAGSERVITILYTYIVFVYLSILTKKKPPHLFLN